MENYGGYLGILKWSLAQQDGTKPSEVQPLSEEDRAFFEKAVEAACETDASKMKKILDELKMDDIDDEKRMNLLELLEEYLENLDNAVDFQQLGGYQFIIDLIRSTKNEEVILLCFSLLGTSCQNQPKIQKILTEANIVPQIMDFVINSDNMKLKTKGIRCISCIISNYEPGSKSFLFNNGLNLVKNILFDDSVTYVPLLQKSLILLKDLAFQEIIFLRKFLSKDLINRLTSRYICHEDIDIRETTMYLIQYILKMPRQQFVKEEIVDGLRIALPKIQEYCSLEDTPAEIKEAGKTIEDYVLALEDLNLTVHIMPCKHSVSVTVNINDTIGKMKERLSEVMHFPAESMKIVNGGRPCIDSSTVKENGLNYCSRVICAAKGYVPDTQVEESTHVNRDSKLLIKMDGSTSYDVPYYMSTTWRQLKISLQKLAHVDPLDFVILLNDNIVNDNDIVSNAHVNYMSVIHAVRTDFHSLLNKPLQRNMFFLTCPRCKKVNPPFVVRPVCVSCKQGFIVVKTHFSMNTTSVRECFQMKGVCKNRDCCKRDIETDISLMFVCKACTLEDGEDRSVLSLLYPTEKDSEIKSQLNHLYGYLIVCFLNMEEIDYFFVSNKATTYRPGLSPT